MKAVEIRALNFLRYRRMFNSWHTEIRPEFWSSVVTRRLWEYLCFRYKNGGAKLRRISISAMEEWVEAHSFKHKDQYADVFLKMRRMKFRENDQSVLAFLRRTRFKYVLEEGIALLGEPDGLTKLGTVRDRIDSLVKLSERATTSPISYFETTDERTKSSRKGVIRSGICAEFDRRCGGGIGVGELHIWLGATNVGKTAILCNATAGALKQGKNVVYFTLDDCTGIAIARRVDQILLGVPEEKILAHPTTFKRKLRELKGKGYGNLYILDHNDRDTSVLDIRANVENLLDDGIHLDLVVIDYIDVMVSSDNSRDEQRVFLQVCRGLKKVGREHQLRVYTAGQGNRSTIDADEIKLSQMAGAISKAKSADVVFGINQTQDQRAEDLIRLTCLRSRVFRRWDDEVWVTADWDTMQIQGIREEERRK